MKSNNVLSVEVYPDKSRGRIDPNIYGLHLEHIWNCVYPGLWVGPESKIPNTNGIRNDVAELLADLRPAVCKYPGGYFTELYDWRDGVGPRSKRPVRVCPTEPNRQESNQFGTAEFMAFCRLIGADPYLSVNTASLGPLTASQWVEYCNLDGNTYWANKRREHGHRKPFNVRYWAVGNEQYWFHSAEEYAERYRCWAHFMYNVDPEITLVISGLEPEMEGYARARHPWNGAEAWGKRFMRITRSGQAIFSGDWNLPPDGQREIFYSTHPYFNANADCTEAEYYRAFSELTERLPKTINTTAKLLDKYRGAYPRPRLCFDEYGLIHPGCSMSGNMTQPAPFWAALWLGCFFQICHEHPREIGMANLPGTINMEQELVVIEDGRAVATPSYHLFKLYRNHGGAESVESIVKGIPKKDGFTKERFRILASIRPETGNGTISVLNLDLKKNIEATVRFRGRRIGSVSGNTLNTPDIHACNTAKNPFRVKPRPVKAAIVNNEIIHTFPPHSVTVFEVTIK